MPESYESERQTIAKADRSIDRGGGETLPKNLTSLNVVACGKLTDQSIVEVAKHCPNLTSLNASYCTFTKLPRFITTLKNLTRFDISGNPLQEPPIAIAKQGIPAIARYFAELDRGGSATSMQLKVVLVGDGEVGKTSLRRAIRGDANPLTRKVSRTIHLDIERVEIKTTLSGRVKDAQDESGAEENSDDEEKTPPPLTLVFYDCGGQREYATGQAPFLTGSALFLLIVPANHARDDDYEQVVGRFLVLLQTRAPGAVVQLILSKTDLLNGEDEIEEKREWLLEKVNETMDEWRKAYEEQTGVGDEKERTQSKKGGNECQGKDRCILAKKDRLYSASSPRYCAFPSRTIRGRSQRSATASSR